MGRSSADPWADQRPREDRNGGVLWATTRRRAALTARRTDPCRRAGQVASCQAGDDRYADGGGRNVHRDMHRVAMTRKPIQSLAPRLVCPGIRRCVTPEDPVFPTRGDAKASTRKSGTAILCRSRTVVQRRAVQRERPVVG